MAKEFVCPSCSAMIVFAGGESIFQTCKSCNAPVVVPSEFLYEESQQLASENFASLVNDKPVDVEQVTNELTPGRGLPKDKDSIDPEARIEKFEVYQEKIGTHSIETKKAVDEIVAPKESTDFKTASPFASADGSISLETPEIKPQINNVKVKVPEELKAKKQTPRQNPKTTPKLNEESESQSRQQSMFAALARIENEVRKGNKIEAIKIFRGRFKASLHEAKNAVEAMQRGEKIDISKYNV